MVIEVRAIHTMWPQFCTHLFRNFSIKFGVGQEGHYIYNSKELKEGITITIGSIQFKNSCPWSPMWLHVKLKPVCNLTERDLHRLILHCKKTNVPLRSSIVLVGNVFAPSNVTSLGGLVDIDNSLITKYVQQKIKFKILTFLSFDLSPGCSHCYSHHEILLGYSIKSRKIIYSTYGYVPMYAYTFVGQGAGSLRTMLTFDNQDDVYVFRIGWRSDLPGSGKCNVYRQYVQWILKSSLSGNYHTCAK